jgi:tripartite-type tricarboxylate transporter receptor subunit TctC
MNRKAHHCRRLTLKSVSALLIAGVPIVRSASAQNAAAPSSVSNSFPNKNIRLIVGFPPGGGIDFAARTIQGPLQDALKTQLIIDYKPGAGGVIAASELARATPDGYTLLVANTGPFAIAPYTQLKKPYDPKKDFSYIGQISEGSYIVVLRADHPAKSIKELIDWCKTNPTKANFASAGLGSSTHLNGELFNQVAGLDLTHVPYKGSSAAIQDLLGGQTTMLIDAGTALLPQIKSGKLRALAVTGPRRDVNLPDIATVKELGFAGMESAGFQGLVGPAGMPKELKERIAAELAKVLQQADIKAKFVAAGSEAHFRNPEAFSSYVTAENDKWAAVIKKGAIKLD